MALLSAAMRTAAVTGSSRPIDDWLAGRQWGLWADQWVAPPHAAAARPARAGDAMSTLEHLHTAGVIDDAEFARLRARVHRPA